MVPIIAAMVIRTPPASSGDGFSLFGWLVFFGVSTVVGLQFLGRRRQRWLVRGRAMKPVFAYLTADGRAVRTNLWAARPPTERSNFWVYHPPTISDEELDRLLGDA